MRGAPLLVVGDSLLDVDLSGTATRLTPDAPVPVLEDVAEHVRPGGAALAATLLARDGHDVTLVTALADDRSSARLRSVLPEALRVVALPMAGALPRKVRVRADGQSLARLDHGGAPSAIGPPPAEFADLWRGTAAVLVSDYGRGMTAHPAVREAISLAVTAVPVVWDPHPRGAPPVPGVRLATPNRAEAASLAAPFDGAALPDGAAPLAITTAHARTLVNVWQARGLCVTLGAAGVLLSYGGNPTSAPLVLPAPAVDARDCCGAGDRFAASLTAALARGLFDSEAAAVAVAEAAAFVARGGASGLTEPGIPRPAGESAVELASRVRLAGGTVVATGGCFDLVHAGHVAMLRAARALGDCLIVCLNSDASVHRLKGCGRPLVRQSDRARVLAAMTDVDAVAVFDEDTPASLLRRLRPHVWAKGGDYRACDLPEAEVLGAWGGQAVVLPYLDGRSTTGLVRAARDHEEIPA